MADTLKILADSDAARSPSAATLSQVYRVPTGGPTAMLSRILIANRSSVPTSFRIALQPSAAGGVAGIANGHYIAYDVPISGNETINFAIGAGLATGDYVLVYATLATLSFTPCGIEVT